MSNFYGLIGEKLGHSLSPQIQNKILRKLNIDGTYNLFEVKRENLKSAVDGLKALGCRGVNVTIPYKIEIMQYLDRLSKETEQIGAVNTVAFSEDGLIGCNTDYYGFGFTLKRAEVDILNKKAVILGVGGASKAVVQYLIDNGVSEITYVSRDPEKAFEKIKECKIISYSDVNNIENQDIIINCTPCGMYPVMDKSPVDSSVLSKFSVAVDLIYNPVETLFLKNSRELGLRTANGIIMLVAQAAASQEIWQGTKFSYEFVEELYNEIKFRGSSNG